MDKSTLVLTQIIFRHGQRAPDLAIQYKNDPHANEKYLPFGPSELTLNGMKQCYHLGEKLRQRYSNLLGPEYYNGVIDAKTSDRSRTRMSLQLVLASLYPPTQFTEIHPELNWHPIPFTCKPIKEDKLIGCVNINMYNNKDCPDFGRTRNSLEIKQCFKEKLEWEEPTQFQCVVMYDIIRTQVDFGLDVPEWCKAIYPEKLEEECHRFIQYNFDNKDYQISAIGGLIEEINKNMLQKVSDVKNGKPGNIPNVFLYSGHDANITGLLSMFNQYEARKFPTYTANFAFELHQIDGEFFVRMVYQNGPKDLIHFKNEKDFEYVNLPNSKDFNTFYKLKDFGDYVQGYYLKDN